MIESVSGVVEFECVFNLLFVKWGLRQGPINQSIYVNIKTKRQLNN